MRKFNVSDRVVVRGDLSCDIENVVDSMLVFSGQETKISELKYDGGYGIEVDGGEWWWGEHMLEGLADESSADKVVFKQGYMDRIQAWDLASEKYSQFQNILENFVKPGTTVYMHNNRGQSKNYDYIDSYQDNVLHIVSHGYDKNRGTKTNANRDQAEALGIYYIDLYEPLIREDEKIYYENGCPLAVYNKSQNVIWLLWHATYSDRRKWAVNSFNIIIRAFEYFAKTNSNENIFVLPEQEEFVPNKKVDGLKIMTQAAISRGQRELSHKESEIKEMLSNLAVLNRSVQNIRDQMSVLYNRKRDEVDIANKYIRHIERDGSKVMLYTDHIYITEFDAELCDSLYELDKDSSFYENCTWYIGLFRIDIDLVDFVLRFYNLNNPRKSFKSEKDCHPHVWYTGEGCLGDLTEIAAAAFSNGDVQTLADMSVQYLQSVNLTDVAGRCVRNWDFIDKTTNTLVLTGEVFEEPEWKLPSNKYVVE